MRRPAFWLVVAGLAALFAATRPWWHVGWGAASGEGTVDLVGSQVSPASVVLPGALLGGTLLLMTLRATGRRVVAVLLGLLAGGMVTIGVLNPRPDAASVAEVLATRTVAEATRLDAAGAPWAFAAAGVVGLAAAAWLFARPVADSSRPVRRSAVEVEDSLASWKAMDDGLDPTTD